jgi:hypothetical protein
MRVHSTILKYMLVYKQNDFTGAPQEREYT